MVLMISVIAEKICLYVTLLRFFSYTLTIVF